jgi:hypothetical protein
MIVWRVGSKRISKSTGAGAANQRPWTFSITVAEKIRQISLLGVSRIIARGRFEQARLCSFTNEDIDSDNNLHLFELSSLMSLARRAIASVFASTSDDLWDRSLSRSSIKLAILEA